MAKDTYYFTHDYNSRTDAKIKKLLVKHGVAGYGCFWAIIEDLHNNQNSLPTDFEAIAFDLRVESKMIESIVKDFDLFIIKDGFFGSSSIEKRMDERNSKSVKARESAYKRWKKEESEMRTQCDRIENGCEGNAIKERKGKESKVKEKKEREKEFREAVAAFADNYDQKMINAFCDYWTESSEKGKLLRYEKQTVFEISRRLEYWQRRSKEKSFGKKENITKHDHRQQKLDELDQLAGLSQQVLHGVTGNQFPGYSAEQQSVP